MSKPGDGSVITTGVAVFVTGGGTNSVLVGDGTSGGRVGISVLGAVLVGAEVLVAVLVGAGVLVAVLMAVRVGGRGVGDT